VYIQGNNKNLLVTNTHYFIHVVIHSFPGPYVMIWRETRKRRVEQKKKTAKTTNQHWCLLQQNIRDRAKPYCHMKHLLSLQLQFG